MTGRVRERHILILKPIAKVGCESELLLEIIILLHERL